MAKNRPSLDLDEQLPVRLTPGATDHHCYEGPFQASPQRIMERTLSLKAALLIACAVGLLAGGLTYLRFGVPGSGDDPGSATQADADPRSGLPDNVAYMTPKTLREIEAQLDDKHTSESVRRSTLPETNPSRAESAPYAPRDVSSDFSSDAYTRHAPEIRQPAAPVPNLATQPLRATTQAFPGSDDPDALERAIKQRGWKSDSGTKSSN